MRVIWFFLCILFSITSCYADESSKKDVNIGLYITDITEVNEQIETVELEAILYLGWQDDSLIGTERRSYSDAVVGDKLKEIWSPTVVFTHLRGQVLRDAEFLEIRPNGMVRYFQEVTLEVQTNIDMQKFPFDTQVLQIKLEGLPQGALHLNFIVDETREGLSEVAHLEEWDVTNLGSTIQSVRLYMNIDVPEYVVSIGYERRSGFYVFKVFVPFLVTLFLTLCVFWLGDQPIINRISVVLTILLTIVAYQWLIVTETPKVSYHTFFYSVILLSYVWVAGCIAALVIGDNLSQANQERLMKRCRWLFPSLYILAMILLAVVFFIR